MGTVKTQGQHRLDRRTRRRSPPLAFQQREVRHAGLRRSAELTKDGVRVTTVLPGLMRTGSTRHALFKGEPEAEYTWFSLGGSIPLTAMDAERAAREIVNAALSGTPEVTLGWQSNVLGLVHDLAPSWTIRALGLVSTMIEPTREMSRQYNELSTHSTPEFER